MKKPSSYDSLAAEYDCWFDDHPEIYSLELQAVRQLIPASGRGVEIGVGTGRFAAPLGITLGVEPSPGMGRMARQRGVKVVRGYAESLPFLSGSFDFILYVTVICFLDDVQRSIDEVFRILKNGGEVIVAFIDKRSPMGKKYSSRKGRDGFYRDVSFHSPEEVERMLGKSGFTSFRFVQTLIEDEKNGSFSEVIKEGHGEGSFVVINGKKQSSV